MEPLTEHESRFAEEHYNVVYAFLHKNRLPVGEYHGIVIIRYLGAVQRYLAKPELQKYSFTTIAWNAMRSALYNHRKSEKRRADFCPIVDTEYIEGKVTYSEDDSASEAKVSKMLWLEVASYLTESQIELLRQRADGWTLREIGEEAGITTNGASSRLYRLRQKVKSMCDWDRLFEAVKGGHGND